MVLVEGKLCPAAIEVCMKEHPEWVHDHRKSERCLIYKKPTVCATHVRIPMRFCIDRYEWPDKKGALPRTLTPWYTARKLCASVGKRLCDEPEWLFACEGEQMLPYTYGYKRDPTKCSIDRPYIRRRALIKRWDECMKDPVCKKEFARLDQRKPSGSMPGCVSPFGVYDMNGNVNEWVNIPGAKYPHRAGLKGGWWGPVRDRCRPTVIFHKEEDWGYEVGFRCCKYPSDTPDAGASPLLLRYPLGGRGVLPPPHHDAQATPPEQDASTSESSE